MPQDWTLFIAEYQAVAFRALRVLTVADDAVYSSDVRGAGLLDGCSRSVSPAREVEHRFPNGERRHVRYSWQYASALHGRHAAFVCDNYSRHGSALQLTRKVLAACSGLSSAWRDRKNGSVGLKPALPAR